MAVSLNDRSFNYGDGTFTTMQVQQGRIQLWPLHLQRLQHAATVLGFTGINWQQLQQQEQQQVQQQEQGANSK